MSICGAKYTLSRPIVLKALLGRGRRGGFILAVLLGVLSANVAGHEIPGDVTIQAWLKPEGQRLRLVVRVPLVAMRDMDTGQAGQGRGNSRHRPGGSHAPRRSDALGGRAGGPVRRGRAPGLAHRRRRPRLLAVRSIVRDIVRGGPGARHRATATGRHGIAVERRDARCSLRVRHPIGPVALLDQLEAESTGAADEYRPAAGAAERRGACLRPP